MQFRYERLHIMHRCIVYFVVNGEIASFTWHSFAGICWQSVAFSHAGLLFSVVSGCRADFFRFHAVTGVFFDPSYKTAPPRFVLCNMTSLKQNAVPIVSNRIFVHENIVKFFVMHFDHNRQRRLQYVSCKPLILEIEQIR